MTSSLIMSCRASMRQSDHLKYALNLSSYLVNFIPPQNCSQTVRNSAFLLSFSEIVFFFGGCFQLDSMLKDRLLIRNANICILRNNNSNLINSHLNRMGSIVSNQTIHLRNSLDLQSHLDSLVKKVAVVAAVCSIVTLISVNKTARICSHLRYHRLKYPIMQ